jgi:hypothetical protein
MPKDLLGSIAIYSMKQQIVDCINLVLVKEVRCYGLTGALSSVIRLKTSISSSTLSFCFLLFAMIFLTATGALLLSIASQT